MPDLLLELFSEEIPARMQRKAAEDLRKLVTDALVEAGLVYEGAKAFATPRRLALTVHGLPARSPDRREERKGPRVGAPEKAVEGFLKAAGLTSIDQAKIQPDKKGDFYVALVEKRGRTAEEVIAEIVPPIVRAFPWPKSMRWGSPDFVTTKDGQYVKDNNGNYVFRKPWLTWVRPLHSILCVFGPETSDTEVVRFDVDGIASGDLTHGHRFMAPGPITVKRFDDYAPKLEKAKVVLDADRRKEIILADARDRALALGLELVEDDGLLEEVAGLVEWPVVLVGAFDEAFLSIPPEVIRTTIRNNQKCFVLRGSDAPLSNRFVLVANIEAPDGGRTIVAGNERVIRARLSDARHFYDTDRRDLPGHDAPEMKAAAERLGLDITKPLDQRMAKLAATNVVFHEKLGTQGERVERIARLAEEIADVLSARPGFFSGKLLSADDLAKEQEAFRKRVRRAAVLAKADLTTEMVGEFPELQGLMGRYYATAQGEDASVAAAIEDHYKPVGPSDRVPTDPVAICIALADKLDLLVGFWAIDEKPTGSKDPYALRRAALGVIRVVLETNLRFGIWKRTRDGAIRELVRQRDLVWNQELDALRVLPEGVRTRRGFEELYERSLFEGAIGGTRQEVFFEAVSLADDLLAFFADRLKVQLREQGARHDLVDAVFALGQGTTNPPQEGEGRAEGAGWGGDKAGQDSTPSRRASPGDLPPPGGGGATVQDDLLLIVRRVEALGKFLDTEDGEHLLTGYRRATNILREEEKKSAKSFTGEVNPALLKETEEKALFEAVGAATGEARAAVEVEDFDGAMRALAELRAPVDLFFDKVRVNDEDPAVRENRLRLLNQIREATLAVADFSRIEG